MQQLVHTFPEQLEAAYANLSQHPLAAVPNSPSGRPWQQILVLGMGGSGISGSVAAGLLRDSATMPILTCSDYAVPAWVGPETAVIACSYSGNTEETLATAVLCSQRGARMACVTGDDSSVAPGGAASNQLARLAADGGWPSVMIPAGHPPRSQFGHAFAALLHHLVALGAAPAALPTELPAIAAQLRSSSVEISEATAALAAAINGRSIILYGATSQAGILTRWRQQLNENSKLLACHNVFPEMNHNELVGWESGSSDCAVIMLHSPDDPPRTQARMNLCRDIFSQTGASVYRLDLEGASPLARAIFSVHWGDWLSIQLASINGTDPVSIRHIDFLKDALSKLD